MKSLFFASLLVLSSASVALAQCRNGWCRTGCITNGDCRYVKLVNKGYPIRRVRYNSNRIWTKDVDCQQYRWRLVNDDGTLDPWMDAMPGSLGEAMIETACNM